MAEPSKDSSLTINQDLTIQKRYWLVQRIGWLAMAAIVLAAVLGLLGGIGPLNETTQQGTRFSVEYRKYVRRDNGTTFSFTITPQVSGNTQLLISRDFLDKYDIKQVIPQPDTVQSQDGFLYYTFQTAGSQPLKVTLNMWPSNTSLGVTNGQVGSAANDVARVRQVVLP